MTKLAILTCYDILPNTEKLTKSDDFLGEIKTILTESKTVASRIRYLSDLNDEGESQFISNFQILDDSIFCSFLYMEKGSGVNISENLMNAKSFDLEEAEADSDSNITGHIKESTYFLLSDKYLVMKNSRGISKDAVSIYLNYLLENMSKSYKGKTHPLSLNYHIKNDFDVSKIRSFELNDRFKINRESVVSTISKTLDLKTIFKAVDMDGLSVEEILSASIVFKIKKLPKESKAEQIRIAQTIFEAFNDENVKFMGKNNTPMPVKDAKTTKDIYLYFSNNSRYPDKECLKRDMIDFISEVEHEKKNSS